MKITFDRTPNGDYQGTAEFEVDGLPWCFEMVSARPIPSGLFRRKAERKLKWHLEYNRTKIRPKYALSL